MSPQHLGHFLRGFNLRAHGLSAPCVKKGSRQIRRRVMPKSLKRFFPQLTPDRLQIIREKPGQHGLLFAGQILRSLEQKPARFGLHGLRAFRFEFFPLLTSIALLRCAMIGNRSKWMACSGFLAITCRYGCHMSLQTNCNP